MNCSFGKQKSVTTLNAYQKVLEQSNRKPNKIFVDIGSVFCNRSIKLWLKGNDKEIYSVNNQEKFVVA